jgi:hypothetical protein
VFRVYQTLPTQLILFSYFTFWNTKGFFQYRRGYINTFLFRDDENTLGEVHTWLRQKNPVETLPDNIFIFYSWIGMELIYTVKNDFKIFFQHHILSGVIVFHFWQFHGTVFPEILIGLSEAVPKKSFLLSLPPIIPLNHCFNKFESIHL